MNKNLYMSDVTRTGASEAGDEYTTDKSDVTQSNNHGTQFKHTTVESSFLQSTGYHVFSSSSLDDARGLMTLVNATIPCSLIADPSHC